MPTSCEHLSQHEQAQLLRSNPPFAHHPTAAHVAADVTCVDVAAATESLLLKQQCLYEAQAVTQAAWQHMEPVRQPAGSQRQPPRLLQSSVNNSSSSWQFSAEDAEVSAITFAQQQQQQPSLLHKGVQQQRALLAGISNSGRTSAPPALLTTGGGGWRPSSLPPRRSSCGLLCSAISSRRDPMGFDGPASGQQPDQQHRQQGERAPALPPRVALSTAAKRLLLVERAGSAQLLPYTLSRRSTLLLGVPDQQGSISLDPPPTPSAQLPACWRSHLRRQQGLVAATTVCSPRVIVLPSTASLSGGSVPRPTKPSNRPGQRNQSGTGRNGASVTAQQPPTGETVGALLPGSEMNGALQPAAQQQAAAGAGSRQQGAAAAAIPGDSSAQLAAGSRSLSASPSRGARSLSRQASHCPRSLCLSPSAIGRTPADAGSSQQRPGRRGSSCERPAPVELCGPLDLDAGAPPLSGAERRLGDVQQADVAYIVGRWAHRWQTDRAACAAAAAGGHALSVHAEAAWVRPASALHLFGDSQATFGRQFGSLSGGGLLNKGHPGVHK